MRITIINGFFLPVPPVGGGATEKTWFTLAGEFAARGHEVTMLSRRWRGFPDKETISGVRHVRLPGHDHQRRLGWNLWHDFVWSWRVFRALPAADIVICNAVSLPMWLGWLKPSAGKVVVMCGRMPKGQYRRYTHLSRILAPSNPVRDRIRAENPSLDPLVRVVGYPIDWNRLASRGETNRPFLQRREDPAEVTIGFVGRLHREKGLLLLAEAVAGLRTRTGLPPWRIMLCGPSDVAHGGSGAEFRSRLLSRLSQSVELNRLHILDPQFNDKMLASIFQRLDVFCYPSLAEEGETFGVAVAEAMAAGAAPVVSDLACFREMITPEEDGLIFDHRAADAAVRLTDTLERLLRDTALRHRLGAAAQAGVRRYAYPNFADRLLEDFSTLVAPRGGVQSDAAS
jgi:glycosyltransferase involved in cell wall biosynthesis